MNQINVNKYIDYTAGSTEYLRVVEILGRQIDETGKKIYLDVLARRHNQIEKAHQRHTLIYYYKETIDVENNVANLTNTYINNFNLSTSLNNPVNKYKDIEIQSINGFFDGDTNFTFNSNGIFNFSYSNIYGVNSIFSGFKSEILDFTRATFNCNSVLIEKLDIKSNINFIATNFKCDNLKIHNINFENLLFNKSRILVEKAVISSLNLEKTNIHFNNVDFQAKEMLLNNISINGKILITNSSILDSNIILNNIRELDNTSNIQIIIEKNNFLRSVLTLSNIDFNNHLLREELLEDKQRSILNINKNRIESSTFLINKLNIFDGIFSMKFNSFFSCTIGISNISAITGALEIESLKAQGSEMELSCIEAQEFCLQKLDITGRSFKIKNCSSSQEIELKTMKFNTDVIIEECHSNEYWEFKECSFYNRFRFINNSLELIRFVHCEFEGTVKFENKLCPNIMVLDCIIYNLFDLRQKKSINRNYKNLSFSNTINLGRIEINYIENNVKNAIITCNKDYAYEAMSDAAIQLDIIEQLRMFKENYGNIGKYDFEDKAYLEMKLMELEEEKKLSSYIDQKFRFNQKNIIIDPSSILAMPNSLYKLIKLATNKVDKENGNVFKNIKIWGIGFLYDIGSFAIDPFKIIRTIISTQIFFILMYILLIGSYEVFYGALTFKSMLSVPFVSAYFSLITFFTIGFGDVSQATFAQSDFIRFFIAMLSAVEGFLGVFLMGYLSVSIVRKTLR